ncbi:MAG TPA: hypothetical protein VGU20_21715 [Stellaceae bacterium]|nr:hypothetical protein [Stellaceae bacterium]
MSDIPNRDELIQAAVRAQEKKRKLEKRRRAEGEANSDAAINEQTGWDLWSPTGE